MVPNAETCCGNDVGSSPIFTKQRCTRPGTKETYDKVNITFDFLVHVLHGQLACFVELDYTEIWPYTSYIDRRVHSPPPTLGVQREATLERLIKTSLVPRNGSKRKRRKSHESDLARTWGIAITGVRIGFAVVKSCPVSCFWPNPIHRRELASTLTTSTVTSTTGHAVAVASDVRADRASPSPVVVVMVITAAGPATDSPNHQW